MTVLRTLDSQKLQTTPNMPKPAQLPARSPMASFFAPASVALILSASQSAIAGIAQTRNSKIDQMELDGGDMVISGVKTVQVEIKE